MISEHKATFQACEHRSSEHAKQMFPNMLKCHTVDSEHARTCSDHVRTRFLRTPIPNIPNIHLWCKRQPKLNSFQSIQLLCSRTYVPELSEHPEHCSQFILYIYIYNTYIYIYPRDPGGGPGNPGVYEDHPRDPWGV